MLAVDSKVYVVTGTVVGGVCSVVARVARTVV